MASSETKQAAIVAAFNPQTGHTGPVEFAWAASRLTGAPLVVGIIKPSGALDGVGTNTDEYPEDEVGVLKHLRQGMQRRGIGQPDIVLRTARTIKTGLIDLM